MAPQGGYGVVVKINTGSLTSVANLLDVEFPKFMKYIAESTGHDSTGGYYEATATGKRRVEPFRMTLGWDTSEGTHAQVVTSFDADTAVGFSIEDPDGDEVIAFNAHIEEIQRLGVQEDVYKAEILVHPTGQPTIT